MSKYFVCISISELQQWLADDSLPVLTGRIFHSRANLITEASDANLEGLFKRLPAFSLDDPVGVLIVEMNGPSACMMDGGLVIHTLEMSDVKRFIPLTEDAKKALSVYWSSVIELEPAHFEEYFLRYRLFSKEISDRKAGDLFLNLFIKPKPTPKKISSLSQLLSKSLPRAILAADHQSPEILGAKNEENPTTWMSCVFGYTRRDPIDRPHVVKSFVDIGKILREVKGEDDTLTNTLRSILLSLPKEESLSLGELCSNQELADLKLDFIIGGEGEQIELVTIALFLRWKQSFHDARSIIDIELILNDVKNLEGLINLEVAANALWMMGAYVGMEYVSPLHRFLKKDKTSYSAVSISGEKDKWQPIQAWSSSKKGKDSPSRRKNTPNKEKEQEQMNVNNETDLQETSTPKERDSDSLPVASSSVDKDTPHTQQQTLFESGSPPSETG